MPAISPISGAMYVVTGEYMGYRTVNGDESWIDVQFPYVREDDAESMLKYLTEAIFNNHQYRNMRIAHVQFSEIPDYNDTPPLV